MFLVRYLRLRHVMFDIPLLDVQPFAIRCSLFDINTYTSLSTNSLKTSAALPLSHFPPVHRILCLTILSVDIPGRKNYSRSYENIYSLCHSPNSSSVSLEHFEYVEARANLRVVLRHPSLLRWQWEQNYFSSFE